MGDKSPKSQQKAKDQKAVAKAAAPAKGAVSKQAAAPAGKGKK